MKWLINLINKLFKKNDIKMLNEPVDLKKNNNRNNFRVSLWKEAHIDACDGNGYQIYETKKLEELL